MPYSGLLGYRPPGFESLPSQLLSVGQDSMGWHRDNESELADSP